MSRCFFKRGEKKKVTMVFTRGEDEADSGFGRTGLIQIPILRHF